MALSGAADLDVVAPTGGPILRPRPCRALSISLDLEGSLPTTGEPFIVAANHSSFIDGLVLYVTIPEPLVFVTSVEIERQPFLGRITKRFGCLFVERGRAERSAASVEQLVRAVKEGHHLAIFPEGSISTRERRARLSPRCVRDRHVGELSCGAGRHSRHARRASSRQLPSAPGRVRVVIGSPIAPAGADFSDRVALRDEVRDAIARTLRRVDRSRRRP